MIDEFDTKLVNSCFYHRPNVYVSNTLSTTARCLQETLRHLLLNPLQDFGASEDIERISHSGFAPPDEAIMKPFAVQGQQYHSRRRLTQRPPDDPTPEAESAEPLPPSEG